MAWTRADFCDPSVLIYALRDETLGELDGVIGLERFSLPSLERDIPAIREELTRGRGFVLLRGMPVDRYSEAELSMLYWGLGALIGRPLPQNVKGDRLYAVRDEGQNIATQYGQVGVRFSKTREGLHFHTDSAPVLMGSTPDVIGLFALQVAKVGGESALVSACAAHNAMLEERPHLLERLYQPFHIDRSMEWREGESKTLFAPVFTYWNSLQVRYFRYYIPKGHAVAGVPFTSEDEAALDYFDSVMERPELQVTFEMQRGDIQLVSNNYVLHARTPFEDWPEPERKRHLKRLWIQFG